MPPKIRAIVDSTGFDARTVSRYYVLRRGRRGHQKRWPKLTAVLEASTHIFLAARVTRGPSQDAPHLRPALRDAVRRCPIDTVLADAAYDSEANHRHTRRHLGVRSTIIPLNRRGTRKHPPTQYRRQMLNRFRPKPKNSSHRRLYGQRWQIESGFSRNKRVLGSALRATKWVNQKKELLLRAIVHNLMIIASP